MRIDITTRLCLEEMILYSTIFMEVLFLGDFYHGYSVKYQT